MSYKKILLLITNFCVGICLTHGEQIPAFPGAEGYGAASVGGRGGEIIEVTNLNDSGPGSFRAAVSASSRRIAVFRVAGTIEVKSRIDIQYPYLTIAGQTALGDGILLKGTDEGGGQMLRIRTHDVIIRYLRIRSGAHGKPGRGQINVSLSPIPANGNRYGDIYNIVLDHLSLSWSLNENISIHRNVPEDDSTVWETYPTISDISVQHCLTAEGLYPHSTGIQTGGERIARNGKSVYNGGMGVSRLSIHRNVFANTSHRNPGLGCKSARVINNVMYNWNSKCAETHDAITVDWVGNYFKPGPLSDPKRLIVHNHFFKGFPQYPFDPPSIYMKGNMNSAHPHQDDWDMYTIHYAETKIPNRFYRPTSMNEALIPVTILSTPKIFPSLLNDAGANVRLDHLGEWITNQDKVDQRIIKDVINGTGEGILYEGNRVHYSDPQQVGGYPDMHDAQPYKDTDHDGMPDAWEEQYQFTVNDPSDNHDDPDGDGYTNIEEFLNGTDPLNGI